MARGDLAAGFLAVIYKKDFDPYAPLKERLEVRAAWKRL